ncbi:MAG: GGDEF domain-containing protein [Polyangiaceae bacterium]|nr:GGDEF domain-containing protein [Polyangiaceae bacterium]
MTSGRDFSDFSGSGADERTAVVDLKDLGGARTVKQADRHLLLGVHGSQLGQVIRLTSRPFRIGRSQEMELWLNDSGISRRHAEILPTGEGYLICDLESANGTFVQGQRINRHPLSDGDVIQFGPAVVFRYSLADEDQEEMLRQLYAASVTDPLTGARNRDYFESHMNAELSYARRHRTDVSLLMFDLDHFKLVNDTYGHPAGDAVLVEVAQAVRQMIRSEDVFARYGGEEFAVILRDIDLAGAALAAERLRKTLSELNIKAGEHTLKVTVSVGCATLAECQDPLGSELIAIADRRLYAAKHGGRNRVVTEG